MAYYKNSHCREVNLVLKTNYSYLQTENDEFSTFFDQKNWSKIFQVELQLISKI